MDRNTKGDEGGGFPCASSMPRCSLIRVTGIGKNQRRSSIVCAHMLLGAYLMGITGDGVERVCVFVLFVTKNPKKVRCIS